MSDAHLTPTGVRVRNILMINRLEFDFPSGNANSNLTSGNATSNATVVQKYPLAIYGIFSE
jgi:hypothetical protein